MSYWDTSAMVKLYAKETDSEVFESYALNRPEQVAISRIGLYEARATFRRKEADGLLQSGTAQTLYLELLKDAAAGVIRLVEIGADADREFGEILSRCYQHAPPIRIRTVDALHLASARVASETEIVATDRKFRDAAKVLGFSLFPV